MKVANPAHEQWARLIVEAETQWAKEQTFLNAQHQSALIAFRQLTEAWQIGVGSPNGRVRRLHRGVGRKFIFMHALSVHLVFIGGVLGALAFG
jgi:hypothetical protein